MVNFEENIKHFPPTKGPIILSTSTSALYANFEWFNNPDPPAIFSVERNRVYMHGTFAQLHCFDSFFFKDIDMVKISGLFGSDGAVFKVRKIIENSNLKLQPLMIERPTPALAKKSNLQKLFFGFIKKTLKIKHNPEVIICIGTVILHKAGTLNKANN